MAFTLTITRGPGAGQTLRLSQAEVRFGRTDDNDVVVPDPNISRKHFQIVREGPRYVLRDLGSSNGTAVNGQRVQEHVLSPGDQISAGDAVFVFDVEGGSGVPARRPRAQPAAAPRAGPPARTPRGGPPAATGGRGGPPAVSSAKRDLPAPADPFAGMSARERFKAKKAASTPIGRFRFWFSRQPKQKRVLIASAGGVVGLLVLLLMVKSATGKGPSHMFAHDWSHDTLELVGPVTQTSFGYGVPDLDELATDQVKFKFRYLDGRATLYFDVGYIDTPNEVEIRLNEDKIVGYAPVAIQTWVRGNQIILPYDALKKNDFNTVTFDNVKNPGSSPPESWGVGNVKVTEEPLPPPDKVAAKDKFTLADKLYQEREISPSNLHDACIDFRAARDYLERLAVKPPLYDEAAARIKECDKALRVKFSQLKFTAKKYERFKDYDKAKATYEQMLKYFPDESDPRHQQIEDWLQPYD